MKNLLTKFLLLTLFNFFAGDLLLGQTTPPPPPPNESPKVRLGKIVGSSGGPGQMPFLPSAGQCQMSVTFEILLTNLNLFAPEENGTGIEYLPEGYPPLYLEYSINDGVVERIQLTEFEFLDHINNIPVFASNIESYSFEFGDLCQEESFVRMDINAKLVTRVNSLNSGEGWFYIDYPACDYASVCNIFSPQVFIGGGNPAPPNQLLYPCGKYGEGDYSEQGGQLIETFNNIDCYNETLINSRTTFYIDCSGCDQETNTILEPTAENRKSNTAETKSNEIIAFPNPFEDQITIKLPEGEQSFERADMYNIEGLLMKSWTKKQTGKIINLDVNAIKIEKGIYFLKVKYGDSFKVVKVIKK